MYSESQVFVSGPHFLDSGSRVRGFGAKVSGTESEVQDSLIHVLFEYDLLVLNSHLGISGPELCRSGLHSLIRLYKVTNPSLQVRCGFADDPKP